MNPNSNFKREARAFLWAAAMAICLWLDPSHAAEPTFNPFPVEQVCVDTGPGAHVSDVIPAANGKIMVTTLSSNGATLTRHFPNGFAENFYPPFKADVIHFVHGLSDGKTLVTWKTQGDRSDAMTRLLDDGTMDASFAAPQWAEVYSVAEAPEGKIYVAGRPVTAQTLLRLQANGTVDPTFTSPNVAGAYRVAVTTDGRVFIQGSFTSVNGETRRRMAQLNTNGTLNTAFAQPNALDMQVFGDEVYAIIADGISLEQNNRFIRLLPNGDIDPSFTAIPTMHWQSYFLHQTYPDRGPRVRRDADGRFYAFTGSGDLQSITRYAANGALDASFTPGTITQSPSHIKTILVNDSSMLWVSTTAFLNGVRLTCGYPLNVNGVAPQRIALVKFGDPTRRVATSPHGTVVLAEPFGLGPQVEAQVAVVRVGDNTDEVRATYQTRSGTATAGADFLMAEGQVVFPAGVSQATIPITVLGDTKPEAPEFLELNVLMPDNGRSLRLWIYDNDIGIAINQALRLPNRGLRIPAIGGLATHKVLSTIDFTHWVETPLLEGPDEALQFDTDPSEPARFYQLAPR